MSRRSNNGIFSKTKANSVIKNLGVTGEITSTGTVDIEQVVRNTIKEVGYDKKLEEFNTWKIASQESTDYT